MSGKNICILQINMPYSMYHHTNQDDSHAPVSRQEVDEVLLDALHLSRLLDVSGLKKTP
jgi:hypothetical protein